MRKSLKRFNNVNVTQPIFNIWLCNKISPTQDYLFTNSTHKLEAMIIKNQNLPIANNSYQSRICVTLCHDFCQPQHIDKKMLSYKHFIEHAKQFFTNLHLKHVV
jgi:hypothetical protein